MEQGFKKSIFTIGTDGIQTDRLLLRAARLSDLDSLHTIFCNHEVMKFWSRPPHTTLSQTETYLADMVKSPENGLSDFIIVLSTPSDFPMVIGKVGIWSLKRSEIGFMLNRSYWGKGYMVEALSALIEYLWSGKGGDVRKITADVDPRNDASISILRRFGFHETGYGEKTFETHLGWCDSLYLTLHKPGVNNPHTIGA